VLLPGGFGTMDEAFELLTLVQTGKTDLHPIVMLDPPGGAYWKRWDEYLRDELLSRGYISEDDLSLYRCLDDTKSAVDEIEAFYRVFHSQRVVGRRLVLRLTRMPSDDDLSLLSNEFDDILDGPIEPTKPTKAEMRDEDVPDLPRIALPFDRQHVGRLRQLIDRLNDLSGTPDERTALKGDPRNV
jgi:hypothetical protein